MAEMSAAAATDAQSKTGKKRKKKGEFHEQ
jgi:hypothetical protein